MVNPNRVHRDRQQKMYRSLQVMKMTMALIHKPGIRVAMVLT